MNDMHTVIDIKWRNMSDEVFQSAKKALRELGYLPTPKLIYEMVEKMDRELSSLRFGQIDELCEEDRMKQEREGREVMDSYRRRQAELLGMYYAKNKYFD